MPEIPTLTGQQVVRALGQAGFEVARTRGSHHILKRDGYRLVVTVPVHGNKPLKRGTLRQIIRSAGLTVEEFLELL